MFRQTSFSVLVEKQELPRMYPINVPNQVAFDSSPRSFHKTSPEFMAADLLSLTPTLAHRFARLALDCVNREYPNHILHLLNDDRDALPPRELTPVFFGCFDWHSAVHGHWTLLRLLKTFPDAAWATEAREVLNDHFTETRIAGELKYLSCPNRKGFERPYGLAWLLQLAMESRQWNAPDAQTWSNRLEPLETLAAERFHDWLPKLTHPIRSGEHSQTAFAMGLVFDWAGETQNAVMGKLITERALMFHANDKEAPLAYEPSGHDFLSPALAEADLLRRVMRPQEFGEWLTAFWPGLTQADPQDLLLPLKVIDPSDGKLAHWDGLNLSRAWMLKGIAHGLPSNDPRRETLLATALLHARVGLAAVTGAHYAGGHWLASFAVYLLTQRGLNSHQNP